MFAAEKSGLATCDNPKLRRFEINEQTEQI